MDHARFAPLVGIVGSLLVLVVLALPYAVFDMAAGTTPGLYYSAGAVSPLVAGLFALVTVIFGAAGREDRTDPLLAAGATLALGVFTVLVVALWALTVPADVVAGISESTVGKQHRWILTAVALVVPLSSAWWARSLGVV